ncbi:MAG: hypothetical protein HY820_35635 [Acidobacteria bacterium]|nr:hypothetical protein [Acidobacteriota bacterium]
MMLRILMYLGIAWTLFAQNESRGQFRVRQVAGGVIYLDGGAESGLMEGMKLEVRRLPPGEALVAAERLGDVMVTAVATASALCELQPGAKPILIGDIALMSAADTQMLQLIASKSKGRNALQSVSFTEGDPLEEEARAYVPKPPLAEVNRFDARASFEVNLIRDRAGTGVTSRQDGFSLRADFSRINGSYWSATGYWRGRRNSTSGAGRPQTLTDLVNRTYHIGMQYNNPASPNILGFGRLFVPWASSLSTIDGAYYGRRVNKSLTAGFFGGSTPNPASWNYDPNRHIGGALLNLEQGSFEGLRYSSTTGLAFTQVHGLPERRFLFLENSILFGNAFSVFHNLEADAMRKGRFGSLEDGPTLSRSFLSARYQPTRRLSLDLNHNYFRWLPTFDTRLIGTGLVDQLLFQGLSSGVRVELPKRLIASVNIGRNKRESDRDAAWNQMYGLSWTRVPWLGMRADARYARFRSSFGDGSYQTFTLVREFPNQVRMELQGGRQDFHSTLSANNRSIFGGATLEWFFSRHYFVGTGAVLYRGEIQNYDQIFINLGYRF